MKPFTIPSVQHQIRLRMRIPRLTSLQLINQIVERQTFGNPHRQLAVFFKFLVNLENPPHVEFCGRGIILRAKSHRAQPAEIGQCGSIARRRRLRCVSCGIAARTACSKRRPSRRIPVGCPFAYPRSIFPPSGSRGWPRLRLGQLAARVAAGTRCYAAARCPSPPGRFVVGDAAASARVAKRRQTAASGGGVMAARCGGRGAAMLARARERARARGSARS